MASATQTSGPPEGRSRFQKVYNSVGFKKSYNFFLCKQFCPSHHWMPLTSQGFIFAGALFGFTLARLMYLNISGVFCGPTNGGNAAAPGECYYYENFNRYKIGIRLHLYTILRVYRCSTISFAIVTDTPPSCQSPCRPSIHTRYPPEMETRAPYQWLHHCLVGADRQCRGYHDRSRSLWRNNGDTIVGRRFVHLDHCRPRTCHLQRQDATNRSAQSMDAPNMVLRKIDPSIRT